MNEEVSAHTKPFARQGNFTQFDNAVIDEIMPRLIPNAWVLLCYIIRKTVGWQKKDDVVAIPYSEFRRHTGIKNNSTISEAIKDLLWFGIIEAENSEKGSTARYRLNVDLELPLREGDRGRKTSKSDTDEDEKEVVQKSNQSDNRTTTGSKIGQPPVQKSDTLKERVKDTVKDNSLREAELPSGGKDDEVDPVEDDVRFSWKDNPLPRSESEALLVAAAISENFPDEVKCRQEMSVFLTYLTHTVTESKVPKDQWRKRISLVKTMLKKKPTVEEASELYLSVLFKAMDEGGVENIWEYLSAAFFKKERKRFQSNQPAGSEGGRKPRPYHVIEDDIKRTNLEAGRYRDPIIAYHKEHGPNAPHPPELYGPWDAVQKKLADLHAELKDSAEFYNIHFD